MATAKEVNEHLKNALCEVGKIVPWFDKEVEAWVFEHEAYPVSCSGLTPEEVVRDYSRYLKEFIRQRLRDNLDPWVEKKTKGRGGLRLGAGRPKGSRGAQTKQVRLPVDIANWIKQPGTIASIRTLLETYRLREGRSKK